MLGNVAVKTDEYERSVCHQTARVLFVVYELFLSVKLRNLCETIQPRGAHVRRARPVLELFLD